MLHKEEEKVDFRERRGWGDIGLLLLLLKEKNSPPLSLSLLFLL
jgi:hypothetical protein